MDGETLIRYAIIGLRPWNVETIGGQLMTKAHPRLHPESSD